MLEIGIVIEAVTRHVVGVVRPLPPGDADPREAVTSEDLGEFIEPSRRHYNIMTRIVTQISHLHPTQTQNRTGEHMNPETLGTEHSVETGGEHQSDEAEGIGDAVSLLVEQTRLGESRHEVPIIPGNLGDLEIFQVIAREERVEMFPRRTGMKGDECVGSVLSGEIQKWDITSGVDFGPLRNVVHLPLDRNPQIVWFVVLLQLVRCDVLLWLLHHHLIIKFHLGFWMRLILIRFHLDLI